MTRHISPARGELLRAIGSRGHALRALQTPPVNRSRFLEHYYAEVAEEDLAGRDPMTLAAVALGHLAWAATRQPKTPKVRVFNPTEERDGWCSEHTIVQMVNDDMPFLVDSVTMTLNSLGHAIHLTIHPILHVARTSRGELAGLGDSKNEDTGRTESFIHIELVRETDGEVLRRIETSLLRTLTDVRMAVEDWKPMLDRLRAASTELRHNAPPPRSQAEECCAFLDWLADDHFTVLGYREYELTRGKSTDLLKIRRGTGLGILREERHHHDVTELKGEARKAARSTNPLVITKANAKSTVHRPAHLDYIGVKVFDAQGRPQRERRFLGLFTSVAYSERPRDIPLLRLKVAMLMEQSGLDPKSHRGKALQHILDTFPRDDLFQGSIEELARISTGILNLQERHQVRLFVRPDTFGRFFSCLVYLPRDQYNVRGRRRIEETLREGLRGTAVETELTISESALARLRVTVRTEPGRAVQPKIEALQAHLEEAVRTWADRLRSTLLQRLPEDTALALFHRFVDHFSAAYQEEVDATQASHDIEKVAKLADGHSRLELRLHRPATHAPRRLRFTTLSLAEPIQLYLALPIIENMGFKVFSERVYPVRLDPPIWIQDFELESVTGEIIEPEDIAERFKECFRRVLNGDADNDGFNSFVATARLTWRDAALLRAYCKYLLQTGLPFSQFYMQEVLGRYRKLCHALVEHFHSLFDPALKPRKAEEIRAQSTATITAELERVVGLDEDRILRSFTAIVNATLRTNFFQRDHGESKPYLSFKFDPKRIAELPKPHPKYEIFVYSQRVEALHLRCAKIARGGLRWSDRREDFRTEILGLMKAQHVKNALIVPGGAKGGFVCKQLPLGDREAVRAEVVSCYRTFIRGLLDITDNVVDGKTITPQRVIASDDEDPYLVVAADKGTATFSDLANELSAEYGFWLGDAFASGGSTGYDHKKMAITARGAWEAVKRHFRELAIDVQEETFTVIGIGDMSGDVFGNGMLLSPNIKLIAAFNHQHIFIDPDPDPSTSLRERQRLFKLPRSGWDDYDKSKLSTGGGVYSRQGKSIELHPAAQERLGIERHRVTPPELIKAILTAKADLLWNGGIGTYVKSSSESHGDASDPVNDAVRVNADDLKCRVVAEGGNLGFTQLGRIEYALGGGRINTDFIDNSGGVDCSDREVNIKILLDRAIASHKLAKAKRNALLADMTEQVAALVLANNYAQTQALSMMASSATERLGEHARLIRVLEAQGLLDRTLEYLPTEEEIEERRKSGRGLTRPELAVILSYSKIELTSSLTATEIPEDPYLAGELAAYFPRRLSQRFKTLISQHPLRREIIAMLISGSMINRMGPFFVLRAEEETGASVAQVARAYAIVREIFGIRLLWREIEALDNSIQAEVQYGTMFETSRMVRRAVYWFLQRYPGALQIEPMIRRFQPGAAELSKHLDRLISGRAEQRLKREVRQFEALGLPGAVAQRIASLAVMTDVLDIIELAEEQRIDVQDIAVLHFEIARGLKLDWIREQIEKLHVDGKWRAMARATLREHLAQRHRALLKTVLQPRGDKTPSEALAEWVGRSKGEIARTRRALDDMQTATEMDFATLSVALEEVSRLI